MACHSAIEEDRSEWRSRAVRTYSKPMLCMPFHLARTRTNTNPNGTEANAAGRSGNVAHSAEQCGKASVSRPRLTYESLLYRIKPRWTIEQPLALWTYDDEFISSQMSFDDEPVNCCVVFFFLRKGCRVAVMGVLLLLLSTLLTRLRYHAMNLFLSSIELLTLTRSSVSVFCVLLSLCSVCFCLCVLCASA